MNNSECCDATLLNYNDGLGLCSDCKEWTGQIKEEPTMQKYKVTETRTITEVYIVEASSLEHAEEIYYQDDPDDTIYHDDCQVNSEVHNEQRDSTEN